MPTKVPLSVEGTEEHEGAAKQLWKCFPLPKVTDRMFLKKNLKKFREMSNSFLESARRKKTHLKKDSYLILLTCLGILS